MRKTSFWKMFFWLMLLNVNVEASQTRQCLDKVPSSREICCLEERLTQLVNNERCKRGLIVLCSSKALAKTAKGHSKNMADGRVAFGHGGFDKRAQPLMQKGCHIAFGENVAFCYLMQDPLKTAVDLWMRSPEHRKNILGDYNETGMGIAYNKDGRCFMTQLFAKRLR